MPVTAAADVSGRVIDVTQQPFLNPSGVVLQNGAAPLTANWNAGNFRIDSQNSTRWFNVIAYGADPTGVADSTAAINTAITAALALGGVVYFPQGHYKITSTITLGAFATVTRGLTIIGDNGSYANPAAYTGATLVWAGGVGTPMLWVKNFQYLTIAGLGMDGANVATSAAILLDNDGTGGASTSRISLKDFTIRRFTHGICVGSLVGGATNVNQIDTVYTDNVNFFETQDVAAGAAVYINCSNFAASRFRGGTIFSFRYGFYQHSFGSFSVDSFACGASGANNHDVYYCDGNHGTVSFDNSEGEVLGTGHMLFVTAGANANLNNPITVRNCNLALCQISQATKLVTEGCQISGAITFATAASNYTSIGDTLNGGSIVVGASGTSYSTTSAALGTTFATYTPPMSFIQAGAGGTAIPNTQTTFIDVTGATVTFTPLTNCRAVVVGTWDVSQTSAGADMFNGTVNLNAVDQAMTVNLLSGVNGSRFMVSQSYALDLNGGTSYTLKMRAKTLIGGANTWTVNGGNSTIAVTLLGRY